MNQFISLQIIESFHCSTNATITTNYHQKSRSLTSKPKHPTTIPVPSCPSLLVPAQHSLPKVEEERYAYKGRKAGDCEYAYEKSVYCVVGFGFVVVVF